MEVRSYKRGPVLGCDVKPGHDVEPKVAMRRLTAAEEALIRDHMRSQRGVDRKEARDVASDMAGKDAAFSDSLPAHLWVGEAQIDARDWDAAEVAADRALKINPESSAANLLKANVFMGRGKADKSAYAKARSEEHTSELQSLMRISYAVFCLNKKQIPTNRNTLSTHIQQ